MWWLRFYYPKNRQGDFMWKHYLIGFFGLIFVFAAGCTVSTPTITTSPLDQPISPISQPSSPLTTPTMQAQVPEGIQVVPFTIDRPLRDGDVRITGSGVPGIQFVIEDVTFAGRFIAAGQFDESGRFDIQLSAPLEARHRIGLILNLADTSYTEVDFSHPGFMGEGSMVIPQLGFYHDTFMVLEP